MRQDPSIDSPKAIQWTVLWILHHVLFLDMRTPCYQSLVSAREEQSYLNWERLGKRFRQVQLSLLNRFFNIIEMVCSIFLL